MNKRFLHLLIMFLVLLLSIPLVLSAVSATSAVEVSSGALPGDINADGKVNLKDVVELYRYIVGWDVEVDEDALDTDGDGTVTVDDAYLLFRYSAGWEGITLHRHTYTEADWVIDKEATKTEDGSKRQVCSVCGSTIKTEIIYATGSKGLEFALNSDKASYYVKSIGTCADTEVVIPAVYEGKPITRIGQYAFYNRSALESVNILQGITSIGRGAFSQCRSLTNVIIPDSVTVLDWQVFANCASLKSIHIPKSVISIGFGAFSYNSDMNVTLELENPNYHIDGNCLIETKSKTLICGFANSVIPSDGSVVTIAKFAFEGISMKEIVIPACITNIGYSAFAYSSLKSITIPNSVEFIDAEAFDYCSSLESVILSDNISSLGNRVFYGCESLTSITIPSQVVNIGEYAFALCTELETLKFEGTKKQWTAVTKGTNWNQYSTVTVVSCTDGNVSIS